MAKQKFERTKPHVNVGTISHVDHGKTHNCSNHHAARPWQEGMVKQFDEIDNVLKRRNVELPLILPRGV